MVPTKKLNENEYYIKRMQKLLEKLNIKYNKIDDYLLAFVHKSLINERSDLSKDHNERLEFLGDAVLELIITTKLYKDFPEEKEGVLTDYRSSLVKGKHLAKVSRDLDFQSYLILGKGEEKGGGRENDYLLANALEAFIGALYLDLGYDVASGFVLTNIYDNLQNILGSENIKDYKSLFQEFTQAKFGITPSYELLNESGLDHEKTFEFGVYLKDEFISSGIGTNKKKAQEDAAKNAYKKLFNN